MPNYTAAQIDPFKLSYIMLSGDAGHTTFYSSTITRDLICYPQPDLTSNDGYPLGLITQSTLSSSHSSAASALVWLKISAGVDVDPIYVERANKIRTELANYVLNNLGNYSYSDRLNICQDLFVDLDVQLIYDAITQRMQYPDTWSTESLGDINSALNVTHLVGTTWYKLGDLDLDGEITTEIPVPPTTIYTSDIYTYNTTTNTSHHGLRLTSVGTMTNTLTDGKVVYIKGGTTAITVTMNTYGGYNTTYTVLVPELWTAVNSGERLDLRTWLNDPDVTNHPGEIISIKLTTYTVQTYPPGKGDRHFWLDLFDPQVVQLGSNYLPKLYYVHSVMHNAGLEVLQKLLLNKISINSNRIRCSKFLSQTSISYTAVRKKSVTSFSTDFKYLKKDPAGQFKLGGAVRCPTFAGVDTNGDIPDNPNFGGGITKVYQSYVGINGTAGGNSGGMAIDYQFSDNANWYFTARINERIEMLGNTSVGAIDLPDSSNLISSYGSVQIHGLDMEYSTQSDDEGIIYLNSTGRTSQTFTTAAYGVSGRAVQPFYNCCLFVRDLDNNPTHVDVVLLPNWYHHTGTDMSNWPDSAPVYIPKGEVVIRISPKQLMDEAVFALNGNSLTIRSWLNSFFSATTFNIIMGWHLTGVNGIIVPTNFDFVETL